MKTKIIDRAIKPKLLSIDDDNRNQDIISELFGDNYDLRLVNSGLSIDQEITNFSPDVILLDIMMPDIDGMDLLQRLRSMEATRLSKIIMLSAKNTISDRLKSYELGADDYIGKPFNQDELLAKVRAMTRFKRIEEIDQLKKNFINVINHEISSSLALISDGIKSLDEVSYMLKVRESIEMISSGRRWIENLLNKAVLYIRLVEKSYSLNNQRIHCNTLLKNTASKLTSRMGTKNTSFVMNVPSRIMIEVDFYLFILAVESILEYCIDTSLFGNDEIHLQARKHEKTLIIDIFNSRNQTMPTEINYLAGFRDTANPQHNQVESSFGLPIARKVCELYNGKLELKKSPEDTTHFSMSFGDVIVEQ